MLIPLHGIASRHDLPLPFSFVVAGAAAALVLSFVILFFAWRRPRFLGPGGRTLPALTRLVDDSAFRWTLRGAGARRVRLGRRWRCSPARTG